MQCMKCGRDVEPGQVFCEECQKVMEKYPVKPGTVVQLPRRAEQASQKKQPLRRRPMLAPEEQVKLLRKLARTLAAAVVLLILVCVGLGWLSVKLYLDGEKKVLPGQNYFSAVSTTAPAEETTEATETVETETVEIDAAG